MSAIRERMIFSQLRPNKVTDQNVTNAMMAVPREAFVPGHLRDVAYVDEDLEVAEGRFIMEPMVLARLLMAAEVKKSDVVLEVGCSTGYAAAILARLAETVVAIEEDRDLSEKAAKNLDEAGVDNAVVLNQPHAEGCPEQAPFDIIFVNGAVARKPESLLKQLGKGGRLVTVLEEDGTSMAVVYRDLNGTLAMQKLFDAHIPVLKGFEAEEHFVF